MGRGYWAAGGGAGRSGPAGGPWGSSEKREVCWRDAGRGVWRPMRLVEAVVGERRMATSTLTVRTLALATVALTLACVHAVRGDGAHRSRSRPVAPVNRGPAVANLGGSRSTQGVATFSGGRTSGRSGSVATFSGQRRPGSRVTTASRPPTRAGSPVVTVRTGVPRAAAAPQARQAARPEPRAAEQARTQPTRIVVRTPEPDQAPAPRAAARASVQQAPAAARQVQAPAPRRIVVTSSSRAQRLGIKDPMREARAAAQGDPALLAAMATPAPAPTLERNAFAVGGRRGAIEVDASRTSPP